MCIPDFVNYWCLFFKHDGQNWTKHDPPPIKLIWEIENKNVFGFIWTHKIKNHKHAKLWYAVFWYSLIFFFFMVITRIETSMHCMWKIFTLSLIWGTMYFRNIIHILVKKRLLFCDKKFKNCLRCVFHTQMLCKSRCKRGCSVSLINFKSDQKALL